LASTYNVTHYFGGGGTSLVIIVVESIFHMFT